MKGELHRIADDLAVSQAEGALGELVAFEAAVYLRNSDAFRRWLQERGRL